MVYVNAEPEAPVVVLALLMTGTPSEMLNVIP